MAICGESLAAVDRHVFGVNISRRTEIVAEAFSCIN